MDMRTSPLPQTDYLKSGKIKPLRKDMLKKLLKYEFRYLLPTVLIGVGVLLCAALLFALQLNALQYSQVNTPLFVTSVVLYVYANLGVLILSVVVSIRRLYNNFFKSEGALTFSIPATAEEHVFAKHIASLVCSLISLAAILVGAILLAAGGGQGVREVFIDIFSDLGSLVKELVQNKPLNGVLLIVEGVVSAILSFVGVPCILGALTVFLRKFSGKKKALVVFLIIVGINGVANFFSITLVLSGIIEKIVQSLVSLHIAIWVLLVLQAAVVGLCLYYEVHILKKKLDL